MLRNSVDPMEKWRHAVLDSPAYRRAASGEDEIFWEECSDVYIRNRTSNTHYERVIRWLIEKPEYASMIEIGPGPGIFTRFLVRYCARVTAVEPSPANAAWLTREMFDCKNLRVIRERWEDVEMSPHDAVFTAGTLYLFRDIETAVLKMLRSARDKVLIVTMHEEQHLLKEVSTALNIPPPSTSGPSMNLLTDVLNDMNVSFQYEQHHDEAEYSYPDFHVLLDLWKNYLGRKQPGLTEEHLGDLKEFFMRKGLYEGEGSKVNMPRSYTTYMIEISV